jgi:hypothetical protein
VNELTVTLWLDFMSVHELEALAYLLENFGDESVYQFTEAIDKRIVRAIGQEKAEALTDEVSGFFTDRKKEGKEEW